MPPLRAPLDGMMLARMSTTSFSPKMLPNRRSDSDITRERWLITSIGSMIGASATGMPGGAAKCFR